MRIALLHYHQHPSGVNQIIALQEQVLTALGHEVIIPHLPELDYSEKSLLSGTELLKKIEAAYPQIQLWIIHNPTLGKNATYPDFIKQLAETGTPLVLQCHDFAEDGRPTNYERISNIDHLYPLATHIHYATINSRDAQILEKAGIPNSQIHFLPNAVTREPIPSSNPDAPFVLYPVRGIRRKNIGEFCLWAKHATANTRFAIASRPENAEWIATFEEWQHFAAQENLPIDFAVVTDEYPFEFWLKKSTHLATTSIAEGFGLTFIEPHFLGRPLIGRDLPEITRDFTAEGLPLDHLYSEISVPLSALNLTELEKDFRHQITSTFSSYQQSLDVDTAWANFIQNNTVDFGNLPESHQQSLIQNHHFPALKNWLAESLSQNSASPPNTQPWSIESYQNRIEKLIQQANESLVSPLIFLNKERLLTQFLAPNRFHFLRT